MHNQIAPRNTRPDSSGSESNQHMTRQAMSSREITELTGKRHDNVLRDIRAYVGAILEMERGLQVKSMDWAAKGGLHLFEDTPVGGVTCELERNPQNGELYPVYFLDQSATLTVVAGYNVLLRKRIIDRWLVLEEQVQQPRLPTNFAEALQVAADQARENQHLHLVIEQQASKVAALEQLAGTRGSICITEAAKHLGMGPLRLFNWMSANRWIYRRRSFANWSAFQPRLSAGLLEHKLVRIPNNESEELKTVEQVMVTRRGLVVLAEKIGAAS